MKPVLTFSGVRREGPAGDAAGIAAGLVNATDAWGPIAALAIIYLLGSIMTEVITNAAAAAAVLLFPFCLETARRDDADQEPCSRAGLS